MPVKRMPSGTAGRQRDYKSHFSRARVRYEQINAADRASEKERKLRDEISYLLDVIAELRRIPIEAPSRTWDLAIRAAVDPAFEARQARDMPGYAYDRSRQETAPHAEYHEPVTGTGAPQQVIYVHDSSSAPSSAQIVLPSDNPSDSSVVMIEPDDSRIAIADVLNDAGDSVKRPWSGAAPEPLDGPHKRQRTT
ncbi:hypothetical protein MCUN1_002096 [Malassezia cuniculi]|uniref:Uncharacterized protein n=1 Tax=Malassezia cuniculi TaxID=948313 RepID=A0AAF0ERJ4_9BASI|nr:hypothetical protein MCUN1_002096 [Malassezia cuniculi]